MGDDAMNYKLTFNVNFSKEGDTAQYQMTYHMDTPTSVESFLGSTIVLSKGEEGMFQRYLHGDIKPLPTRIEDVIRKVLWLSCTKQPHTFDDYTIGGKIFPEGGL